MHIQRSLDGVEGRLSATLPGAEMDVVETAIRERADQSPVNPETGMFDPNPTRLADGLVELCATTGDDTSAPTQVTVHADLDALVGVESGVVESETGSLLANQTARRLACDAVVETAVYVHDQTVGVGRRTRTIPGWLRRQLYHRDGGCRFPGCGRTRWVHGHHIVHWAEGGPTDLENLVILCGFHHRFLHEHGWTITGPPRGQLKLRKPDGRVYPPLRPNLEPRLRSLVGAST